MAGVRKQGASVASSVQKNFRSIGRSMQRVGTTMTQAITLPILGIGAASAKVSSNMQDDLAQAAAQADLTGEQVSFIGDAAEETAIRTGESTSDIIEAYKFTISAGKSLAESQKIVGAAAEASAAGFGKQRDLVRTATTAMNAYGDEIGSGREFMDALVGSAQNMELEVSKLSRAFQKNVGIAKQLDIGMGELMASIGSVSEIMGDANRGGRLFSTMMAKLLKPTGEGAEAIEDVFGSVSNLRESIADRGLLATMVELRKELEATSEEGLGLVFSQRSLEAALNLTNQEGARTKEIMSDTADTAGATASAFQKSATFSRKLSQSFEALKSAMRPIGNTIINALKPAIESSIELFKNMGDSLKAMSDEVKQRGLVIAGVLGASGPIIAAVGALTAALGAISWPVVLGVGAFVGATTAIANNWDSIVSYFTSGGGAQLWDTIKQSAKSLFVTLKDLFQSIADFITAVWGVFGDDMTSQTESLMSRIVNAIEVSLDAIGLVLDTFTLAFTGDWDQFWTNNEERVKRFGENLKAYFKQLFTPSNLLAAAKRMTFMNIAESWGKQIGVGLHRGLFGGGETPFDQLPSHLQEQVSEATKAVKPEHTTIPTDIDFEMEEDTSIPIPETSGVEIPARMPTDEIIQDLPTAEELTRGIGEVNFADKIFPPGSLGALQERLQLLREKMRFATSPETIKQLQNQIGLTREEINNLTAATKKSGQVWQQFGQMVGNALTRAVVQGKKLGNILASVARQLASKALMTGLSFLLPGGPAIGAASFFGQLFHEGGIVGGSGNQPIMAKGGEGVFTRDQMKAMGGMMRNGGGGHDIDYSKIEQAFGRAFDKRIQRLGPDEVFAMNAKGSRGF